jgi:hypothetical protein
MKFKFNGDVYQVHPAAVKFMTVGVGFLIIGVMIMSYSTAYTETTTLEKQYIGNASGIGGVGVNCLIMEVGEVYIDLPDVAYPIKDHAVYYFAREHEIRSDLQPGDCIKIKWVYIPFTGYRIREVSKW